MSPTLPLYQCHKQVRAAEIASVDVSGRRIMVTYATDETLSPTYTPIMVEDAWLEKFTPKPGDWLVEYAGGYRSVSPASAFTTGYAAISEDKADAEWAHGKGEQDRQAEATAPASGQSFGGTGA